MLAEVYKNNILISSGQINSFFPGIGLGGLSDANLATIPFRSFSPIDLPNGSKVNIQISVRNACNGSLRNFGNTRLWYNDNRADSKFGAVIGEDKKDYFLRNNFLLSTLIGNERKKVDEEVGKRCGEFKTFGIWTVTP